ncbi:MAG: hypothetical protein KBT27_07885 [Prevotellaceae bacterium]|nr:hypothetical protein [Candidatus Faecinaster equi]
MITNNIKKIVSKHNDINILNRSFPSSLFCGKQKMIYTPTNSKVCYHRETYKISDANAIQLLIEKGECNKKQPFCVDDNGNVMVEAYISKDKLFGAFQVSRYSELSYFPVTETFIYVGEKATNIISLLKF